MKKDYFLVLWSIVGMIVLLLVIPVRKSGATSTDAPGIFHQQDLNIDTTKNRLQLTSPASTTTLCSPIYLDAIHDFKPGKLKSGAAIPKERLDPKKVLGAEGTPRPLWNCFVSLGFDEGYIIASFAAPVKDSVVVWEGSFPKNGALLETADVFGSLDGKTYTFLGEATNKVNFATDSLHPTTIYLPAPVKFIKVVNTTSRNDPNQRDIDDGFDLDAIGASAFAPEYLLSAIGNLSSCEAKTVRLSAPKGYRYQWLKDGVPVSGIVNYADTTIATAGSYQVKVINQEGCIATSDPVNLAPAPLPVAGLAPSGTQEICSGSSITLKASGGSTYQWLLNGKAVSGMVAKADTTVQTAGNYQVVAFNAQGCRDTSEVITIKISPQPKQPTVNADLQVCTGDSIRLSAASSEQGVTFIWTGPNGFSSPLPNPTIPNATTAWSGTYEVRTILNSCTSQVAKVKVLVSPPFTANLGPDQPLCAGNTLVLDAGIAGATYLWSTGAKSQRIQVNKAGKYFVEVVQPGGCSSADTIEVYALTPPTVKAQPLEDICGNQTVFLSAAVTGEDYTIEWTTNGSGSFNQANAPSTYYYPGSGESGKVTFYVKVTNACKAATDTVSLTLGEYASTEFTFSPAEPFVGMPVTFTIAHPKNNTSYRWLFGNGKTSQELQPTIIFDDPGNYQVRLIAEQEAGCPDSTEAEVIVASTHILFIPNIFSPAASHPDNRHLKVFGINIQPTEFSFSVFNRWGQIVYQTNSFEQANQVGWNGSLMNSTEEQPFGVYTWTVKGKFADGTPFSKTGTTTLIR